MGHEQVVTLSRDCPAIQVPYGNVITARQGTTLTVMHQLGDTYTVRTEHGYLMRISADDSEALGLEKPPSIDQDLAAGPLTEQRLWEVLNTIYDPEIPASIVEIGLIYTCKPLDLPDGTLRVDVTMTLTAPGCGMGQVIQDDVQRKLSGLPGVKEVNVDLTFDPPWDPTMMSEAARLQLGMM